ncbi:hypothetical protein ABC304_07715 [Microbacterium sp. 1P10UB]|uniref:hypothetical protein n=1 Tax=unclassified Microbacterium TaxID=2609290 RepID=UPI00399F90DB
MGGKRWLPVIIGAPVLALCAGIALFAWSQSSAMADHFVDEGPGDQFVYPVVYTPRYDSTSAPEQSQIVLSEGGDATLTNVLVGTVSKDNNRRWCLDTLQLFSGSASWYANQTEVHIESEMGVTVLISEVERMAIDWDFAHQLSCNGADNVYASLSEYK